ncbi:pyruvate kinase [Cryomorpha ignava]|uniref:Pyruvate kinase n=1 Tax=Cryomorpha ignava TaxID=101383 RepID=A0A7K3WUQ9_9FLAO|nr:pyruvate kinase [Cryomorpha ignava]NEN25278.1 pyruvate kinase [Cryomorpha ignava]
MNTKKTKIVATLGPASDSVEIIMEMITTGLDVCRINFSHGTHKMHDQTIKNIREADKKLGTHTSILADLQGPKLRVGKIEGDNLMLKEGAEVIFTTTEEKGSDKLFINYPEFARDVNVGERILLDDGKLALEVTYTDNKKEVKAIVVHGGILKSNKGVNLPNTRISLPCLTEKDLKDLDFVLDRDVDWIGLSFVRSARDIIELKHIIKSKEKHARVVAKIEKPEAIDDIADIVRETDAIMVARGDLGVEIPLQNVPLIQKMLVNKGLKNAKPVIVATQMMESMIENYTPTRAEVNDVANAVLDGADAVMLSAETSVGKYPVRVIEVMNKIVKQIETSDKIYHHEEVPAESNEDRYITDSICFNATRLSKRVKATAIMSMTFSGYTAFKISSQRPEANIFVFTGNKKLLTQLSLVWGVRCFYYDKMVSTDHTIADIRYILRKEGYVQEGDMVIHLASMPINEGGKTNMLKLSKV